MRTARSLATVLLLALAAGCSLLGKPPAERPAGAAQPPEEQPLPTTEFALPAHMTARAGYMHNRVTVVQQGTMPTTTWGTRKENRLFFTLQARLGRVLVEGTEGIELDKEGYDVAFVHDKGFVHILVPF